MLAGNPALAEDYRLRYSLGEETSESACLLGKHFTDPFAYTLSVVRDGVRRETPVDLLETFNFLIGLRLESRRQIDGVLAITGTDAQGRKCLILWRNLKETDNTALEAWFDHNRAQFPGTVDVVYVNGDHTLNALKQPNESWNAQDHRTDFQGVDVRRKKLMANDRGDFPDHLTFSQRYGLAPLPEPMQLERISDDLRREIWNVIRERLLRHRSHWVTDYFDDQAKRFSERVLGKLNQLPEDQISTNYENVLNAFKQAALQGKFNHVLDLVEILVNDRDATEELKERLRVLFEHSAYRLDTSQRPYRFFPQTSKEQGETVRRATETLRQGGMEGAATHLRQAAEHINAGQYGDSIADSIHAVESVAKKIDQRASKTLGPALDSLERAGLLKHPALKEAFKKLYGYTNDEQGIRHARLDRDSPDVGLDEAMFMFGACASFADYLVSKHRKAKKGGDQ